jgi:hypothetical protein
VHNGEVERKDGKIVDQISEVLEQIKKIQILEDSSFLLGMQQKFQIWL